VANACQVVSMGIGKKKDLICGDTLLVSGIYFQAGNRIAVTWRFKGYV